MKPKDVGLSPNMPCFEETENQEAPPPITYVHIYECDKFSVNPSLSHAHVHSLIRTHVLTDTINLCRLGFSAYRLLG